LLSLSLPTAEFDAEAFQFETLKDLHNLKKKTHVFETDIFHLKAYPKINGDPVNLLEPLRP
jgi:hypothetical protein